jgi:tRNA modification GTPase
MATFAVFRGEKQAPIDQGLALFFPAPHSFTGEDILELHGHGGPIVLEMVLERTLSLGARLARPGEFSERAFLNGKIDLAQAEALADLINSSTSQAARSALQSLQGEFSERVQRLTQETIRLRTFVEATLDFSDQELDLLDEQSLRNGFENSFQSLKQLIAEAHQGQLLKDGLQVVIAGRPNVGKSSLLNRLARQERAIVTAIPGTTRDVLHAEIALDGLPVHLTDTAGLRLTADPVEQEGVRRARAALAEADLVLFVVECGEPLTESDREELQNLPHGCGATLVHNKIDLSRTLPQIIADGAWPEVFLSARTGEGMTLLEQHLKERAGYNDFGEGGFTARRRHLNALKRAKDHLEDAHHQLLQNRAGELAAEGLRRSQQALSEITGEFTTEDLLGEIFSSFCIGK